QSSVRNNGGQLAAMDRPHGYRGVEAEGHERRRRRQKFPQARLNAPAGSDEPPAYRDEQVEVAKVIQEPEMNDEQLIHRYALRDRLAHENSLLLAGRRCEIVNAEPRRK